MFTNEFEEKWTKTTIMDDTGKLEDVQMFIDGENVLLRQVNPDVDEYEYVTFSTEMFHELITSLTKSEGFFQKT